MTILLLNIVCGILSGKLIRTNLTAYLIYKCSSTISTTYKVAITIRHDMVCRETDQKFSGLAVIVKDKSGPYRIYSNNSCRNIGAVFNCKSFVILSPISIG